MSAREVPVAERGASLRRLAAQLLEDLPGLVSDRVQLLVLELQAAGVAVAKLIAVAVAGGVLLTTAWLALWVGIAFAIAETGMKWGWIALIIVAVNLGAVLFLLRFAKSLVRLVALPATVRRLTLSPSTATGPNLVHASASSAGAGRG